jgi:outer membrane protein insertion porin family
LNKVLIYIYLPKSVLVLSVFFMLYSCSVSKYIPEGEMLYTGAELSLQMADSIQNIAETRQELQSLLKPKPNATFLGMRSSLYFHYKAQKEKPGFIYKWLNKKFGEEPVYFSKVNPKRMEDLMLNRLDNKGFFYSSTEHDIDSTKQFVSVRYKAVLPRPYSMETYELKKEPSKIYETIRKTLPATPIEPGNHFDLALLKLERKRIDKELKSKGYYNFNPDFLIFEADTNQYKNRKFDLLLRLKKEVPKKSKIPYVINSITVYPNNTITEGTVQTERTRIKDINFVQDSAFFKPERLASYILLEEGQLYNPEASRLTSNRLTSIGSYKYANIQYRETDTIVKKDSTGLLDVDIFLSPLTKKSLRAEVQAISQSNGFSGPGVALTYSNRNVFNSGETINIRGEFSYGIQLGGVNAGLNSIVGGLNAELVIPTLLPFSPDRFKHTVPKTTISLGADFFNRSQLYTLSSINTSFGYAFNANKFVFHDLKPISINFTNLSNTTPEFEDILEQNPFLRASLEQQFIVGLIYSFTYNELIEKNKKGPLFFSTSLDLAGNTLGLLDGRDGTVFGLKYAQYAKADIDFRYYRRWGKGSAIVSRMYAGIGLPYGNSNTMPFSKQFFSGGPYSIRAFQTRSLGPGSFNPADINSAYFDQSGNFKLESNIEYRFPIKSYFKGAFFIDAGNIWLTKNIDLATDESEKGITFNDELFEKGKFDSDWLSEVAVGLGFGLRLDIQNFVIRLDVASPMRVPFLPKGERNKVPFFENDNTTVFNFAIGYPF